MSVVEFVLAGQGSAADANSLSTMSRKRNKHRRKAQQAKRQAAGRVVRQTDALLVGGQPAGQVGERLDGQLNGQVGEQQSGQSGEQIGAGVGGGGGVDY